jgi:hypothetical protein
MGEDLHIDGEMLARVRQNLRHITDLLQDPMETIQEVGTGEAGVDALSDRLGEFGDEWDYGIDKISEFASGAADRTSRRSASFRARATRRIIAAKSTLVPVDP